MPLDFPNSPVLNQQYTSNGVAWSWDGAKWLNLPQVGAGNPALNNVGRNLVMNPVFQIAQRGVGPFTANGFTLDRWSMIYSISGQTVSVVQYGTTIASAIALGDESSKYQLLNTFTGSAAAGSYMLMQHAIEDVLRLSGKTVTVSFWANGSAALRLGVCLSQVFGTTGSPSPAVYLTGQSVAITTAWQRYALTFTLPSASGKTLAGGNYTGLEFWYSCDNAAYPTRPGNIGVQSGSIGLWGVQLEIGTVATPLDKPFDYGADLHNCQRFYQVGQVIFFFNAPAGGTTAYATVNLPTTMRAAPTVAVVNTSSSNYTGLAAGSYNATSIYFQETITAAGSALLGCTYTASADL